MTNEERDGVLEQIAIEHLRLKTLKERDNDALDFHSLPVWRLKRALEAAFETGVLVGTLEGL